MAPFHILIALSIFLAFYFGNEAARSPLPSFGMAAAASSSLSAARIAGLVSATVLAHVAVGGPLLFPSQALLADGGDEPVPRPSGNLLSRFFGGGRKETPAPALVRLGRLRGRPRGLDPEKDVPGGSNASRELQLVKESLGCKTFGVPAPPAAPLPPSLADLTSDWRGLDRRARRQRRPEAISCEAARIVAGCIPRHASGKSRHWGGARRYTPEERPSSHPPFHRPRHPPSAAGRPPAAEARDRGPEEGRPPSCAEGRWGEWQGRGHGRARPRVL